MAHNSLLTNKWSSYSIICIYYSTLYNKTGLLNWNYIFFLGTLIGGFSPNFITLLIARIIQALGSGIMMPLMMTTILDIFEPHERGKYMGMFGLVIGLAPAIGPTLSGYLVEYINWRALFYVVDPISAVTFILALIFIKTLE